MANRSRHDDSSELEKSNNLQNEENLRRYTNPLRSTRKMDPGGSLDSGGGGGVVSEGVGYGVCVKPVEPEVVVSGPLSKVCSLPSDSTEMLEMISDVESTNGISSKIYKAQNPEVKKNTSPPVGEDPPYKDFGKHINLKALPLQRTQQPQQDRSDVLTVIV